MSTNLGYLCISRQKSVSYALRGFSILVNDQRIDKIKVGETHKFSLPAGHHLVQISIDFYKSQPLSIELRAGETINIECGDNAPTTLGESISLKAMGKSLKSLVNPGDFLTLRLTGRSQITPVDGAEKKSPQDKTDPKRPRRGRTDLRIFVSYRREDSQAITGRICDRLIQHFGDDAIFRDVDSIPIGTDFRDKIRETIDQASVLIAVIGPSWLEIHDNQGELRLGQPQDYVRLELEAALARGIPVMPVLVDNAPILQSLQLPESIRQLAYYNALEIPREPFFHAGVDKLIKDLEIIAGSKDDPLKRRGFCTGCGKALPSGQKFCTSCGRQA